MARTIRVEEKTYRKLCEKAGGLQAQLKRPLSLDEAIWHLLMMPREGNRITDLAGAWDVNDEEVEMIEKKLREGWRRWKARRPA